MSEATVAKRYADALFQLATEKNNVETVLEELITVKDVFQQNQEAMEFLNHPRIRIDDKLALIEKAFHKCTDDVKNTLKLLTERHRLKSIAQIVDEFIHLYNEANEIADAIVYSVRELKDDEKERIEASLMKRLNKKQVSISNKIDASLLGGIRIRVGNTIFDGSISGQLNRIKHKLGSVTT